MTHPIHQATEESLFGDLTREEFYKKHQMLHEESFMLNSRNMKIFTQSWRPNSVNPLKGIVAVVHGYTCDSSSLIQLTAVAIAKLGFHVCALDLQGHGYSEGARGHIPDINPVVDDCIQYFDSVRSEHKELPAFLYGESLGGALALLVSLKQNVGQWKGLILSGAMCGVSAKLKPFWPLEKLLPVAAFFLSSKRVVLTKPLTERSFKEEWKRRLVAKNPKRIPSSKPTAGTALEMMRICEEIEKRSHEVETPLLVLHGEEDLVCDVESATLVYDNARSKDKTLKILPGVWHQFIGEPEEGVDLAFGTVFSWLEERAKKAITTCNGLIKEEITHTVI
ncbi:caffeoylshikimate esterase-like [Aristolochia californica]|uniref:caffeoylshikimate esterase-like n=1 Tax=Aristolochia californica TaxID=171875 RepID=UPI0035DAE2F8